MNYRLKSSHLSFRNKVLTKITAKVKESHNFKIAFFFLEIPYSNKAFINNKIPDITLNTIIDAEISACKNSKIITTNAVSDTKIPMLPMVNEAISKLIYAQHKLL